MRLLVQRVRRAAVNIAGMPFASIDAGLLVLVGFGVEDVSPCPVSARTWNGMLDKLLKLRIFPDSHGKMNLNVMDFEGQVLAVSQFTLHADCHKGRRPSFHLAAPPEQAEQFFVDFVTELQAALPGRVQAGRFAADMDVALVNWGPVTIMLDSAALFAD